MTDSSREDVPLRSVLLVFAGVALLLAAGSPFWLSPMGYGGEEVNACRSILAGGPVAWPRNGAVSLLLELPLAAAGRLVARSPDGQEVFLAMAPVLATAGIAAILYAWASRLARSRAWGLALALAATFATMLWPYAYIGMETLQSLALLAAGYCALARPPGVASWRRAVAFGALAGLAVSAKSVGFLLIPAVAYLAWRLFRGRAFAPIARGGASLAVAVAAAIYAANLVTRISWWERYGGISGYGGGWLVRDPVAPALNLTALLVSPNKGFLVFAPLAMLGLLTSPAAWRRERPVPVFALLTLGGIACGVSMLGIWSDETWGPRYLHTAVAPLALVFAASRAGRPLRARSEAPFAVAAAAGLAVSALGTLFYYGALSSAGNRATALTLEALQGDPTWNHVRFQALLARAWLGGGAVPVVVQPERVWDFTHPDRRLDWTPVDLRPFAEPQPQVLRTARNATERRLRWLCVGAAIAGLAFLEASRRWALDGARVAAAPALEPRASEISSPPTP